MKHQIGNEHFEIKINHIGAEISSFKSKKSGKEYIWQADPEVWGSHAPVLFPIVGGLKKNTFIYNDKEYSIPRHGIIRKNDQLNLISSSNTFCILQLSSNSQTLKQYPFQFVFEIEFKLINNKLDIIHRVKNLDNKLLYFSLGAHPAFNCPLNNHETYSDYYLQFNEKEKVHTWNLDQEGMIAEKGPIILNNEDVFKLEEDSFANDALIFKSLKSRKVSLLSKKSGQEVLVEFNDFSSLGLWAKPNAPFVCIEPWLGYADSSIASGNLKDKEAILQLEPNKEFKASYSITIKE